MFFMSNGSGGGGGLDLMVRGMRNGGHDGCSGRLVWDLRGRAWILGWGLEEAEALACFLSIQTGYI